ncbi:hypothetical protein BGZ46_006941 [Entomortierella lignicola]|nr:hypothetical protein BGZ46_006941 [Entomortierella lignicola]
MGEPIYFGRDIMRPHKSLKVHQFFVDNSENPKGWSLETFLQQYPLDLTQYLESMDNMTKFKDIARSIRLFCMQQARFLRSTYGKTYIGLIQRKIHTTVKNEHVKENEFELFQNKTIQDQEKQLNVGASHSQYKKNIFQLPLDHLSEGHNYQDDVPDARKRQRHKNVVVGHEQGLKHYDEQSSSPVKSLTKSPDQPGVEATDDSEEEIANDSEEETTNELGEETEDVDSSFLPSSSLSSSDKSVTPKSKAAATWTIYYKVGNGDVDCSERLWSPWLVDGIDVAPYVWNFRKRVLEKTGVLNQSVEVLAYNHIYLFEQDDTTSSLYGAVGAELWSSITASSQVRIVTEETVDEVFEMASMISKHTYQVARSLVQRSSVDPDLRQLFMDLLGTNSLWTSDSDNEVGMTKTKLDPLFNSFICPIKSIQVYWDKTYPPSEERKKAEDQSLRGRRPDFFACAVLPNARCHLFVVEVKRSKQGKVVQNDLEKLAQEMKDSIDSLARMNMDIIKIKVYGMVVIESIGKIYSMQVVSRGVYLMKSYAHISLPQTHHDLFGLAGSINVLKNLRKDLMESICQCSALPLDSASDMVRSSFGSPTKIRLSL